MKIWVWLFLLAAFLNWSISMVYFLRFQLQRISLLKHLPLLTEGNREKKTLMARIKAWVFWLAGRLSVVGNRLPLFVDRDEVARRIALAGHPHGLTVSSFLGLRFVSVLGGLAFGNVLSLIGWGGVTQLLLLLAGLFGPSLWLHMKAKRRQERIAVDLPDFLDTMSVTLQAGIPLEPALKQVVQSLDGPLSEELTRLQQELDLGVPRDKAYVRLMNRNNCAELETLVAALLQGSKLGVPIAQTFQVMADEMRGARMARIKERAARVGPKVTLVTSFLILPGVVLSVMGLLVLHFVYRSGILDFLAA
ncbi:MAG: type II secretion system F family protein [Brevibacillus sp.]|nr:type II secretion system F family protein [Brevibacillus sp.]